MTAGHTLSRLEASSNRSAKFRRKACLGWRLVASALCIAIIFSCVPNTHAADAENLEQRRAHFKQLLADEWEYELRESPEEATIIGDYRYNDRWSDWSLAHVQVQRRDAEQWLAQLAAVNTQGFSEQEQISQSLMVRNLKNRIRGIDLKTYEMPVDQINGAQLMLAQFVEIIPFNTTKQYEDYLARLRAIPHLFDELIPVLKQGEKDKLMPPRYLLEKAVRQCKDISSPVGEANVFGEPVTHFPETVPASERKRLHDEILDAVDHEVRPAYNKLAEFLVKDYAPEGRTEPGVWSLPNGDALYRFDIEQQTTTTMDPEAIHKLGLKEVARIEGEELAIARKLGFSDLNSFRASLNTNPQLVPKSGQEILDKYRYYVSEMQPKLPTLFGLLPKTRLEIRPVQRYREKDAPMAEYNQGTPDGSRPGIVYVNTGDFTHRSVLEIEATAYHEAVPGHHMQISIAQTLPGLPAFRQQGGYTAYVEGWALYAERLGKDVGLYRILTPTSGAWRRNAARGPAGGGHRRALQALEPTAGGRLFSPALLRG